MTVVPSSRASDWAMWAEKDQMGKRLMGAIAGLLVLVLVLWLLARWLREVSFKLWGMKATDYERCASVRDKVIDEGKEVRQGIMKVWMAEKDNKAQENETCINDTAARKR